MKIAGKRNDASAEAELFEVFVSSKVTMPSQGGYFRDSDNLFNLRLDSRSIALYRPLLAS
jgi:hypothetical protein